MKSLGIWKMREGGPWQKCREVGTKEGPVMVTVESAGRWGFRLIPRSGVGLAEPDPRPGDRPDLWVEVDEQAPRVEIINLLVGRGVDAGNLTISYRVNDKNLAARPIAIFYRGNEQGEWTEVARDLPNTGSYKFKSPDQLYQLHIRVTAIDEAGNKGEAESKEPVKVDLKVPRTKQIQVRPNAGEQQSRGSSPVTPSSKTWPAQPARAGDDTLTTGKDFSLEQLAQQLRNVRQQQKDLANKQKALEAQEEELLKIRPPAFTILAGHWKRPLTLRCGLIEGKGRERRVTALLPL